MYDDSQPKPPFTAEELRILGCLLEKQLTTPNNYPLSFNSLTLACNQKSSREPIMNLTEGMVGHTAKDLVEMGWATIQNTERAQRVEHKVARHLKLTPKQQALLAVLLLRHPQTLNELKTRTERMANFTNTEEIKAILDAWMQGEKPLIRYLPASGRREARYFHTWSMESVEQLQQELVTSEDNLGEANHATVKADYAQLEARVAELERRLAALESQLL